MKVKQYRRSAEGNKLRLWMCRLRLSRVDVRLAETEMGGWLRDLRFVRDRSPRADHRWICEIVLNAASARCAGRDVALAFGLLKAPQGPYYTLEAVWTIRCLRDGAAAGLERALAWHLLRLACPRLGEDLQRLVATYLD